MPSAVNNEISMMVAELQLGLASVVAQGQFCSESGCQRREACIQVLEEERGFPGNPGHRNETESPLQAMDSQARRVSL